MDQFSVSALRKKPKAIMGSGIGGQVSGKGDRTIKRVDRSYMTKEKITTDKAYRSIMDQQQEHFKRTEGNRGYGSLIRAEGNLRASDRVALTTVGGKSMMRRNAHTVGGGAAGKVWGGHFESQVSDAMRDSENREALLRNAGGRRGGQQVKIAGSRDRQQASVDASVFAPTGKFQKGDTLAAGTVTENVLKVTVKPTAVYTTLGQYGGGTSFGEDKNATITSRVSVAAESGKDTQGRFEKYQPTEVTQNISKSISVDAHSGVKMLPKYKQHHDLKQLESKIKIAGESGMDFLPVYEKEHLIPILESKSNVRDQYAVKSTTKNDVGHGVIDSYVRLTPNRPKVEVEAPVRKIKQSLDTNKDEYKIRHVKPNLRDFTANSNPSIPTF